MMRNIQYDEFWLPRDARNMGFLFEYCDKVMKDLYHIDIDVERFLTAFVKSNVRRKMELGNPRLLSQSYIDTIECFITIDCGGKFEQFKATSFTKTFTFEPLQRMWMGRIFTKIAYHHNLSSAEVIDVLSFSGFYEHYHIGHEINEAAYLDSVQHIFEKIIR